jgi:hypothetical protein
MIELLAFALTPLCLEGEMPGRAEGGEPRCSRLEVASPDFGSL